MERSTVEERVKQALECLFHNDAFLFENRASEWSIAHKFAEYLQREFPSYHVDREYNREGWEDRTKKLSNLPKCRDDEDEGSEDQERKILPDILIHERGYDDRNLLVIEMKLDGSGDTACDRAKLREFTSEDNKFKYDHGLFIDLPIGEEFRRREMTCEWFQNEGVEDCSFLQM